jgi:hypothetical protein
MAGERNKYVHDPWAGFAETSSRAYQLRLGAKGLHGRFQRVSKREIAQLIERIETQRGALFRFYNQLEPKMPALHERLEPLRRLSLQFANRERRPGKKKARRVRPPRP